MTYQEEQLIMFNENRNSERMSFFREQQQHEAIRNYMDNYSWRVEVANATKGQADRWPELDVVS